MNGIEIPVGQANRKRGDARRRAYLLALLLFAACGGDEGPNRAVERERGVSDRPWTAEAGSAVDDTLTNNGWVTGVVEDSDEIAGAALLTGLRVGENEGYERLVLEFEGPELPAYRIEYVDVPVYQCGSGEPVEVEGDGTLRINLQPANAHTEEGVPTITERASRPGQPIIRELRMICDFDAMVEWVVGVSTPYPFRVLELNGPTRLVIDVRGWD